MNKFNPFVDLRECTTGCGKMIDRYKNFCKDCEQEIFIDRSLHDLYNIEQCLHKDLYNYEQLKVLLKELNRLRKDTQDKIKNKEIKGEL